MRTYRILAALAAIPLMATPFLVTDAWWPLAPVILAGGLALFAVLGDR